jgi:hypothetical protein
MGNNILYKPKKCKMKNPRALPLPRTEIWTKVTIKDYVFSHDIFQLHIPKTELRFIYHACMASISIGMH